MGSVADEDEFGFVPRRNRSTEEERPLFDFSCLSVEMLAEIYSLWWYMIVSLRKTCRKTARTEG
jgi:hypothetical protein